MLPTGKAATTMEQTTANECAALSLSEPTPKSTILPAFTLFIMSPLIGEVLLGATPLTHIGGLVIVAPFYGCGVLLIRELVRRRTSSWWPVILSGFAYMLIEEGLTLQTLFNPDFINAAKFGGRWLGVNFVLTQWEIGYHVVWSICIPILITELLFPAHRTQRWLGQLGVSICAIAFVLAALVLGVAFRKIIMPGFHAPFAHLLITAGLACAFAISALTWPGAEISTNGVQSTVPRLTPPWWLTGILAAVWAMSLFGLFFIPLTIRPTNAVAAFMLAQLGLTAVLVWRLKIISTNNPGWTDAHRWALVFGPALVSSSFGLFGVTASSRIDQIGVASFASITLMTLLILARHGARSWPR
jgi:hypothetical protein